MEQIIVEQGLQSEKTELFGSKFLIGNGYMGYRGTLEEYGRRELTACTLAGLYDQNGTRWREPVNGPNPFHISARWEGVPLSVRETAPKEHSQSLDIAGGVHLRRSVFGVSGGSVTVTAQRFLSMENYHVMALEYEVVPQQSGLLELEVLLDGDIWDINGPHLKDVALRHTDGALLFTGNTLQCGTQLAVAQRATCSGGVPERRPGGFYLQRTAAAGEKVTLWVFAAVYKETDEDASDPVAAALAAVQQAEKAGFEGLLTAHKTAWARLWEQTAVVIEGDEAANLALRYSLYLLLISTPFHTGKVAIPARGLSGQVYKGAMFWDTELYMLPFFNGSLPSAARKLVEYRINTLDGARRKAAEYGYRGAFYAWESQETGDDGCTEYNLNDSFTGRPMRTYFRDKQIHISADVAYGIWSYFSATGDVSLLLEGGGEVILECARFLYSYSYFKPEKNRYELLDVTGADEYHERVNNDAYTNVMAQKALEAAMETLSLLRERHPAALDALLERIGYEQDRAAIEDFAAGLYVPSPNRETHLIEQYDGHFRMEDIMPGKLAERIIKEHEYLGSPCGLAVHTQVIKQADVVLVTALFPEDYTEQEQLENFRYYEPRTEHGSSLSACIYALAAANCGLTDYAYDYFMRAATLDLTGSYNLYVGDLYIGGTHPAANGGSWMVAVQGFGGVTRGEGQSSITPRLPKGWTGLQFPLCYMGGRFTVRESQTQVVVEGAPENVAPGNFCVAGVPCVVQPGEQCTIEYGEAG